MRILFEFEDEDIITEKENPKLWIKDFPCRINIGDMVDLDCMTNKIESPDLYGYDAPKVYEIHFEKDKDGIYQHVWVDM